MLGLFVGSGYQVEGRREESNAISLSKESMNTGVAKVGSNDSNVSANIGESVLSSIR